MRWDGNMGPAPFPNTHIWTEWGERVFCVISFVPNVVILVNQIIELGRCLFFINSTIFHSFEAGNCVSNSSFKWIKNSHKQLSSTRFKTWVKIVTITSNEPHPMLVWSWTSVVDHVDGGLTSSQHWAIVLLVYLWYLWDGNNRHLSSL